MSILGEYLRLIPKGMKNFDKVVDGIVNNVKLNNGTLSQDKQEIIAVRRLICHTCPYMSTNAKRLGFYKSDRIEEHCSMCGCELSLKTASLDSNCGIETHNEENPNNQLPLKWIKTNYNDK
jgi:hypothetical protein